MKTKSRIILGLLLLGAVVWACTDIVFVFKADAVEVTAEQVGKTLVITIPVNATGYDGSNGGPVTLGVKATGPFTVLGVTVDIQYGQNGAPGTIKISGVPTQGGTSTGTFIVTPKCGTFPGGDVTIKWTIHVPGGPIPTIANLPGQKLRQHPIGTYTGELFDQQSHLNQNGPLPFGLNIYYASYLKANNVTSALGTNWMHNYDLKLAVTSTSATATLFQGKTVSFSKSNNLWQLSASERRPYQLIAAGTGYQLLSPVSQLIYSFDSSGALTKIQDRAGAR
jgi:hypothetical protein